METPRCRFLIPRNKQDSLSSNNNEVYNTFFNLNISSRIIVYLAVIVVAFRRWPSPRGGGGGGGAGG